MDKEAAKLLLTGYRPEDATDPDLAEARRTAETDPELAAWFEEQQRFDALMFARLREVPVPREVKGRILQGAHTTNSAPRRWWPISGAIAALLLASLVAWYGLRPPARPSALLAQQAVSFSEQLPALQFVCFDAAAVARWVNEQPGAQAVGLQLPKPPPSLSMGMIGSSVVQWNGHPVVMVCLQNGRRMAMLYILKGSEAADLPDEATTTVQQANWVVRTTKTNGLVRLLATKGSPADLNFPTPF